MRKSRAGPHFTIYNMGLARYDYFIQTTKEDTMKAFFAELARECYVSFALIMGQVFGAWALLITLSIIGGN